MGEQKAQTKVGAVYRLAHAANTNRREPNDPLGISAFDRGPFAFGMRKLPLSLDLPHPFCLVAHSKGVVTAKYMT